MNTPASGRAGTLLFTILVIFLPIMSSAEEGQIRKPLPSPEEIAALPEDGGKEFNRLIFEQSPYLLQHARNPVDWWPWSDEAFERARKEDKPIFLSIGYSTCHWCHVMEHESFEDEEVAELINQHFIPIKVDREERPDIDEVYMAVTQALTGGGGWPMTVLLTPDKDPFFAGTYFPKESIGNRAGIKQVVVQLHKAWKEKREEVLHTSKEISRHLSNAMGGSPGGDLTPAVFNTAFGQFSQRYDKKYGGFGSAPKFPVPGNLLFLLRYHERTGDKDALKMVEHTLTQMRLGGIYDHVGFGIHRYSTTSDWLVPHFEKMLYDQATAVLAYVEAYEVTGKDFYAETANEILTYVQRDMTSDGGGFYSAEDADSEGEEGKFYVWTREEVIEVLGEEDGNFFADTYQFTSEGNFLDEATRERTGSNIPHLSSIPSQEDSSRIDGLRAQLFEHREKRIHPQKDDKILTDWNGLMIGAFAAAAQGLQNDEYADAAKKAADFLLENLRTEDGRLLKRYRQGEAGLTAHLEDHVFVIWGLLKLYETNFDVTYLEAATELQAVMDNHFLDETEGGYFMTANDAEKLIVRTKKLYGGAIPGGNAIAIENLSRFYRMTGERKYADRADQLIRAFSGEIEQQPMVYPNVLCGFDFHSGPGFEVVISSENADAKSKEMIAAIQKSFRPRTVVLFRSSFNAEALANIAPFTETQISKDGKATAYVCRDFACRLPVTSISEMLELLEADD